MKYKKFLNLGCGNRFHPEWSNVDIESNSKYVQAYDLRKGIPFEKNSFQAVYHSHLLEHIPRHQLDFFLNECIRVLKPNGILRIAIPDLEQIAKQYLKVMEEGYNNLTSNSIELDYNWLMIEMYDQVVRNQSGGEMLKYLSKETLSNKEFLTKRCGVEIENLLEIINTTKIEANKPNSLFKKLYNLFIDSEYRKNVLAKLLLGNDYTLYEVGKFRNNGEVHQWMYDKYSLTKKLMEHNLKNSTIQKANQSLIPNWTEFNLDTEPNGHIYKPDSLYIESIKD